MQKYGESDYIELQPMTAGSSDHAFEHAKKSVARFLLKLASIAVENDKKYPEMKKFVFHARNLLYLQDKVKAAVKPNLTSDDYDMIVNFKIDLILANKFADKLVEYDKLINAHTRAVVKDQITDVKQSWLKENGERFQFVNQLKRDIQDEVKQNPRSLSTILSVMQVITSSREVFDYLILEYLKAVTKLPEYQGDDIYNICSVESKVWRTDHYETDVTAIRNCIAHIRYQIEKTNDDFIIHFENHEEGWSFKRDYERKGFFAFFEDYLSLIEMLTLIQVISVYQMVIVMNLKRPIKQASI